jgi:hypothetical protein
MAVSLGLIVALAIMVLSVAVIVEARPEPLAAAISRPKILLSLRLLWRALTLESGCIGITLGVHRLLRRAIEHGRLGVVAFALSGVIAILVVIAVFAIGPAVLLLELLVIGLRRRQDPQVVLGMLEIAFRHDCIAGSHGVSAKLEIFVGDRLRGAAHFHIRSVAFIDAIKRVAATIATATAMTTIAIAAALIVLPWSHTILMLLSELITG